MKQKEIILTANQSTRFRFKEIESLTEWAAKAGHTLRILTSPEMFKEKSLPDAVVNIIGIPNGTHQRFLRRCELNGVRHLQKINDSIVADDKALSNLEIASLGLPVPKTVDLHVCSRHPKTLAYIEAEIGFPCIIKHPTSGFGQGIYLVENPLDFEDVFDLLFSSSIRFGDYLTNVNYVCQEYIASTKSKDLRVVVFEGKALGGMYRENPARWNMKRPLAYMYDDSTIDNIDYSAYDLDPVLAENCERIANQLGLTYAGIDVLFGKDGYVFGEVNSFPGVDHFYQLYPQYPLGEMILNFLTKEIP